MILAIPRNQLDAFGSSDPATRFAGSTATAIERVAEEVGCIIGFPDNAYFPDSARYTHAPIGEEHLRVVSETYPSSRGSITVLSQGGFPWDWVRGKGYPVVHADRLVAEQRMQPDSPTNGTRKADWDPSDLTLRAETLALRRGFALDADWSHWSSLSRNEHFHIFSQTEGYTSVTAERVSMFGMLKLVTYRQWRGSDNNHPTESIVATGHELRLNTPRLDYAHNPSQYEDPAGSNRNDALHFASDRTLTTLATYMDIFTGSIATLPRHALSLDAAKLCMDTLRTAVEAALRQHEAWSDRPYEDRWEAGLAASRELSLSSLRTANLAHQYLQQVRPADLLGAIEKTEA